jgi:translation initiation factor 6
MKNILRIDFDGDPNLGLHGFATDKYCILGNERHASKVKDVLKVKPYVLAPLDFDLVKLLCIGNSSGVVVPKVVQDFDEQSIERLKEHFEVLVIDTKYTCIGNMMLLNDKGIVISPMINSSRQKIEKFFGLKSEVLTIAKMNIVGSLGFTTNKGCLVHPKIREAEKKIIEKLLDVTVDIGTVNFGSPYPGSGLIGNSNAFVVSTYTSGPELGRVTDVLGFL